MFYAYCRFLQKHVEVTLKGCSASLPHLSPSPPPPPSIKIPISVERLVSFSNFNKKSSTILHIFGKNNKLNQISVCFEQRLPEI